MYSNVNYGNSHKNNKSSVYNKKYRYLDGDLVLATEPKKTIFTINCDGMNVANPLIYAAYNGDFKMVVYLVEYCEANIDYVSRNGTSAIMYAFQEGHNDVVEYLYSKGAALQLTAPNSGRTMRMIDNYNHDKIKQHLELLEKFMFKN
ncbi:MAG: hypothetical protein EOP34_12140 [Rickettsiales bacterium]|nr:MAG: hypothetical protein EOP34_12140 [Rickettsiales bacterium]